MHKTKWELGIPESYFKGINGLEYCDSYCLPPMSIVQTEKIFSTSVLAQTLPKPTLVKLLKVKYREAM